jgi:hypothetical protein
LLNTFKMLVSIVRMSNLASQKESNAHTINEKNTFFTHNSATEQLRICQFL